MVQKMSKGSRNRTTSKKAYDEGFDGIRWALVAEFDIGPSYKTRNPEREQHDDIQKDKKRTSP